MSWVRCGMTKNDELQRCILGNEFSHDLEAMCRELQLCEKGSAKQVNLSNFVRESNATIKSHSKASPPPFLSSRTQRRSSPRTW